MPYGSCRYPTVTTNPYSPSSAAKQAQEALGVRLRELRKDAGLTARALAAATGQHFTRVSKIEHGIQSPTDNDIRAWCHACRAEDHIPDLIATLRTVESAYLEFRRQSRAGMKRVLGAHTLTLYERTKVFRIYEHNVILYLACFRQPNTAGLCCPSGSNSLAPPTI
jgi:transcriptional regulator with XRE-family HTH domain